MRTVSFWLGRGSPAWKGQAVFGIHGVNYHPNYRKIFPDIIAKRAPFMIQTYRGGVIRQKRPWEPVRERVKRWTKEYPRLHSKPGKGPILSYSDGKQFIIIRQRRPEAPTMNHRLDGVSRKIYLYCEQTRSMQEILNHFKGLSEDTVGSFVNMMVEKK